MSSSDTESKNTKSRDDSNTLAKSTSKDNGIFSKKYTEEYLKSAPTQRRGIGLSTDANAHITDLVRELQAIDNTLASPSVPGGSSDSKSGVIPDAETAETGQEKPGN